MRSLEVKLVSVAKLKRYPANARTHSKPQIRQIAQSIKEFGWTNPLLVRNRYQILAGHARLDAAELLKIKQVPCIEINGLTEAQYRALILADNQLALNAGWDVDILRSEIQALKAEDFDIDVLGFEEQELKKLVVFEASEGQTDPDEVPEPPAEPITQPGDLWILGEHRLLCGDATKAEDVEELIGTRKVALVLTDPPYGVGVEYAAFDDSLENAKALIAKFFPLLDRFRPMLICSGVAAMYSYPRPDWILGWVHPAANGACPWGFAGLHPILAYGKDPYLAKGRGSQPSVLVMAADREEVAGHPTPKPIKVWRWFVERGSLSEGDLIFDPFLGSGTTLIACQQLDRRCFGLELSPAYCDVIVKRWEAFTGKKAERQQAAVPA